MQTTNDNERLGDNVKSLEPRPETCDAGCGCCASGRTGKIRWIAGAIVLVAAGILVARAVVKDRNTMPASAPTGFAALPAQEEAFAPAAKTDTIREIAALSELNTLAADTSGVFVFLPAKNAPQIMAPVMSMQSATRTIESQSQIKMGIFTLKADSPDYARVAAQMEIPGVLAMVKGGGMSSVSGEITEAKLIQAFLGASSMGACGSGGCGPVGCN